jgi:lipoyl(octanoyl) transferase
MPLVVRNLGFVPYAEALALQEDLVARRLAGPEDDQLLLLEHEPVFTLGRGADEADLLGAPQRLGVAAHRVRRGGGVTFHGPGQLVAYPILSLPTDRRDIRRYVHDLESVLVAVCADFGVAASAGPHPGVWVDRRKLAAIGVGVRRWVTCHGVALNVSTDVRYFEAIVPCKVPGMTATSLAIELGAAPPMEQVCESFAHRFREAFTAERVAARVVPQRPEVSA